MIREGGCKYLSTVVYQVYELSFPSVSSSTRFVLVRFVSLSVTPSCFLCFSVVVFLIMVIVLFPVPCFNSYTREGEGEMYRNSEQRKFGKKE